ncbi:MAG: hypothetical protein KDC48_16290, partial [Planctomycetes bacterium]|nr:hypothetical protein [Planctomycetota bacterium]
MNFAAPWFLLAAAAIPALWLLAARSRTPLPRAQRLAVTALQTVALLAAVLALAQPWREGEGHVYRIAVAAGPGAEPAVRALREAAPHADPFVVIGAGATPVLGMPQSGDVPAATGA